jgi:membrane glycosyltransferase
MNLFAVGGRYDYMILLDADSLLSSDTLLTLMQEMASDEKSGIIQTLPCLYRGDTLFARLQQFAGTIYGPIVARGITAWQGNDGNYWGHNAIIKVSAFAQSAGEYSALGGIKSERFTLAEQISYSHGRDELYGFAILVCVNLGRHCDGYSNPLR